MFFSLLLAFLLGAPVTLFPESHARPGAVDPTFAPRLSPWLSARVPEGVHLQAVLQPDGKILVTDSFDSFAGTARTNLARLNRDGSLDGSFDPSPYLGTIFQIQLLGEKPLLLESFRTSEGYYTESVLMLLAPDGSPDQHFFGQYFASPSRLLRQFDGRILLFSDVGFSMGGGVNEIYRLNTDGSIDPSFSVRVVGPTSHAEGPPPLKALIGLDGATYLSGSIRSVNGVPTAGLVRLGPNGDIDHSFEPFRGDDSAPQVGPSTFAVQADGRVLIPRNPGLLRLKPDGSIDESFEADDAFRCYDMPTIFGGSVFAVQSDGRIVATIAGEGASHLTKIARALPSGRLDPSFHIAVANDYVTDLLTEADGGIIAVGNFTAIDGTPRNGLARLQGNPVLKAACSLSPLDNSVRIAFAISSGDQVILQVSSNLRAWTPVATNTASGPILEFQDALAGARSF